MAISVDTLRVGHRYYLINHGEKVNFTVVEKLSNSNFKLKDLYTLEYYELRELTQFGKGKDYDLREL